MFFRIVNYLLWIFFFLVTLCSYSGQGEDPVPFLSLRGEVAGTVKPDCPALQARLTLPAADPPVLCRQEEEAPSHHPSATGGYSQIYGKTIHPL